MSRPSVFYTGRNDGILEGWDMLYDQGKPLVSQKVTNIHVWTHRYLGPRPIKDNLGKGKFVRWRWMAKLGRWVAYIGLLATAALCV